MNIANSRLFGDSSRKKRSTSGVILATADIVIIIPIMIMSVVFLVDAGLACVYKQKLAFILSQAAEYSVNLPPSEEPQLPTERLVKKLCKECGLNYKAIKIKTKAITIEDNDALSVTAVAEFPLLEGSPMPLSVSLSDTSAAVFPANRVCAAIAISPYPYSYENPEQGPTLYLPIIQPKHTMPVWQFPYDTAINNLHHVQGPAPTGVVPIPQNPFFNIRPSIY